jgi:hypothetical protein
MLQCGTDLPPTLRYKYTTWYVHSHFERLKLWNSSIQLLFVRVLGRSRQVVSGHPLYVKLLLPPWHSRENSLLD